MGPIGGDHAPEKKSQLVISGLINECTIEKDQVVSSARRGLLGASSKVQITTQQAIT